jgi:DNA-binding beta-propeller fold protein YncE
MKHVKFLVYCGLALAPVAALTQAPLVYKGAVLMPEVPQGPYSDHLAVDLAEHRLFATPQAAKSVDVLDLQTGKVLKSISGFGNPHSVFYAADLHRLFVADGGDGSLKVFDSKDYHLIKRIALLPDADGIAYDKRTKYLYVNNGGEGAGKDYSLISVVDTVSLEVKGEIRLDADKLEATQIDPDAPRMFANLPGKNQIAVIDLNSRKIVSTWSVAPGRSNMALAYDPVLHRLYVGCRDTEVRGQIVVLDATNGKRITSLPIGGWTDQIEWDAARNRLYTSCGTGQVFTYQLESGRKYRELPTVDTAILAKTSLFVPSLDRLYVSAPHLAEFDARVMIFAPATSNEIAKGKLLH